jgi:hypothetical protein
MLDYQQGKIYTIRCRTDNTLIYVGSTTQQLCKRFYQHKIYSNRNKCKHLLFYKSVNDNWDNWYIELYELYPCSCKEELERKEGEIIRLIGNLNMKIAGRTHNEYRQDHLVELKEKRKEWENNNKDSIKEYQDYYREQNREKNIKYARNYYDLNKGKILEKITCDCGCILARKNLKKHKQSKTHLHLINITVD